MHHHPGSRIAGISGLVFVGTGLVASFGPGAPPAADDGVEAIRSFLIDGRTMILMGGWLSVVGMVAVLVYAGHLHRTVADDDDALGPAFLMAAAVAAAAGCIGTLAYAVPAWSDGFLEAAEPGVIQLVWNLAFMLFAIAMGGTAVVAGVYALRAFDGRASRWSAWLAAVVAALCLVGTLGAIGPAPSMLMFAGYLGWLVFVTATSIAMLTAHETSTAAAPSPA